MNKKKIVFTDMDGTFYQTENDVIQPGTLKALETLRKEGIEVFAATGRSLNSLQPVLDRARFDGYILMNGGYVLDKDFCEIDKTVIPDQEVEEILQFARDHDLGMMLECGDSACIYTNFYPVYKFSRYANLLNGLLYDPTLTYHHDHGVCNIVLLSPDRKLVEDFVSSHPDLRFDLINIKTDGFAYDFFPSACDKANAIEHVLAKKGRTWQDAITIGDSTNDIQMLRKAGLGIAMGSAKPVVKEAADYVTASVYDEGIFHALDRIEDFIRDNE